MAELSWYVRRVRSMDKQELLWRARRASSSLVPESSRRARSDVLQRGISWERALEQFRDGVNRPVLLDRGRARAIAERCPELVAELIDSADRAVNLSVEYFGYPEVLLPRPIDWNYDPVSGTRWPDVPAKRIDHRTATGDVKWIWELNRLQHLVWLSQAWLITGDSRYSSAAFEQLDSWIQQNPPGHGIAWRGAFEAGIRAISIAVAVQGLRDAPELTPQRYRLIVETLAESARRCWRDRSLFSSANNHLIGEMAGLATVAMFVPELRFAPEWESRAVRALSVEADRQILPDGSGAEQAVGYQMFTAELLHLVAAIMAARDGKAPEPIIAAIARSSAYLAAVVGVDDPDPRYGDDDEGFALRLGPERLRTVRDHLGIVAATGYGARVANGGDSLGAQWYLEVAQTYSKPSGVADDGHGSTGTGSHFARDGGLAILRSGRRRVTMDVGPLGYLSIAAHGHADALAITLSADGNELIEDPGTASYYGNPDWRSVMRGTSAHATVTVDGQDQSLSGGPFLWSTHASTTRVVDLTAGVVDAEHDGYTRLPGSVVHRRWLVAPPEDRVILVVDLVVGDGCHQARTCWPLHPDLDMRRIEGGHAVYRNGSPVLEILTAGTMSTTLGEVKGDSASNMGWSSRHLESRVPAWWLSATCTGETPIVLATLLTFADGVPTADLRVASKDGLIVTTWTEGGARRSATIEMAESATVRHGRVGVPVSGAL
jgi:heparinase II/III-like protein